MIQARMTILSRTSVVPAMLFFVLIGLTASPTFAQDDRVSPSDLRRENDQLKERIAQLEAQLEEANRRAEALTRDNMKLRREITQLKRQAGEEQSEQSVQQKPTRPLSEAPPESPLASPDSLFNALVESYEAEFAENSLESESDRRGYLRDVNRWTRQQERELRDRIDWVVSVEEILEESRGRSLLRFRVVNPDSGKPYGEMIGEVVVSDRIVQPMKDDPTVQFWRLEGTLAAKPETNADREEPGLFNTPPLIGPFAEFGYQLSIRSVHAAEVRSE